MYFSKFPQTFYSLDDRSTVQIVTNIFLRVVLSEEIKNNFSVYDLYDIQDGDTPENLAYQIYGDTNLHWLILHANEIIDPRFDWVLDVNNLSAYVAGKYSKPYGVHHYENSLGSAINGNIQLTLNTTSGFSVGSPLLSNNDDSIGFITSIPSAGTAVVTTTKGGFQSGDQIYLSTNANVVANVSAVTAITGTAVTNYSYEEALNEGRRRIKLIKPQFVERIVKEFESKLAQVNA